MSNSQSYRVNPETETPPQVVRGKNYSYRYAYARSADCRVENEVGQDFLVFYETEDAFLFALCDGVSQSFFGDIAARVLGDGLMEWLGQSPTTSNLSLLQKSLSAFLGGLTEPGNAAVQKYAIPTDLAPMLQEVLEEKRALGSESTFVCGRIDMPSEALPQGRVLLAWMGDSRLRFWGGGGERTSELGDTFHTNQRWSTKHGPVNGEPHIHIMALTDSHGKHAIQRLMAYSDGLALIDNIDATVSNFRLNDLIYKEWKSSTSDDVSFLELWLDKLPDIVDKEPSKKVSDLTLKQGDNQRVTLNWKRVPRAISYEVVLRNQKTQYFQTKNTKWTSEPLPIGKNGFWVRALWANGEPGLWSEPVGVNIPEPKPEKTPDELGKTQPSEKPLPPAGQATFWTRTNIISGGLIGIVILAFLGYFAFFNNSGKNTTTQTPTMAKVIEETSITIKHPPLDTLIPTETVNETVIASNTPEFTPTLEFTPAPTLSPTTTPDDTNISQIDGMTLIYIPAGEFEMGSEGGDSAESPVHTVYIDAFWMDEHEVTIGQYNHFLEETDYTALVLGGDNHPVTNVSWHDAKAYCEWAGRRLPTEAEWEKAARGGLEGKRYPWGDEKPICNPGAKNGAQFGKCNGETAPIKTFAPNGYGLYDMAGNVREWVADWFADNYYSHSPAENPSGPENGEYRVMRGGSWNDIIYLARSAFRGSLNPDLKYTHIGFRCAHSETRP